jgi:transcriptional regulator GlxA family with amidase domain
VLFPSLPLLVYTEMTPGTAAVLLQLGRAGIRRVVLHRFEDSPASLRAALRAELEWSATQQIMGALDEFYHGLPAVLREALQAMLHAPIEAATVAALAARAQMTRRTCERWFFKLRLPSPHTAVVLMRMLYAHRLLLDPGYTVDDVAVKMGYGRSKTMQMHLREAFGLTAGELRVSLSAEEGIQLVIGRHFAPLRRAAS